MEKKFEIQKHKRSEFYPNSTAKTEQPPETFMI